MNNLILSISKLLKPILPPRIFESAKVVTLFIIFLHAKARWYIYPYFRRMKYKLYPKTVAIFLTTRCNLRCFICRPEGFKGSDVDFDNLRKLEQAIKYAETIDLTGWGEPFLYPQMSDVLSYIYSINPRNNLIQITSNGSLLSRRIAKLLVGHLKLLTISLNAATPETYATYMKYNFAVTLANIREFLSELPPEDRGKIRLHFVAQTETFREIPLFVELARELGVSTVTIGNYIVARKDHLKYALINVKDEYNRIMDESVALGATYGIEVLGRTFFHERQTSFNPDRNCLDPFNAIFILPDGTVGPCCFALEEVMGNAYENDFESVWFGEKYRALRKRRNLPPCKKCVPFIQFDNPYAHINSVIKTKMTNGHIE